MNRALRRISIAVLVMFVLLLVNVSYLQGFDTASLAGKQGNYLLYLETTVSDYNEHKADYIKWYESIRLD